MISALSILLPQTGNPAIAKLAGTIGHPVHDTFLTLGIMDLWMNRPKGHRREGLVHRIGDGQVPDERRYDQGAVRADSSRRRLQARSVEVGGGE